MTIYANRAEWLADPDAEKVYTAILTPIKEADGTPLTVYLSTDNSQEWDGDHYFEPCIDGPPSLTYRVRKVTGGDALIAYGDLALLIEQGEPIDPADSVEMDSFFDDYLFEGHPIRVLCGGSGLAWDQWLTNNDGYMEQVRKTDAKVSIEITGKGTKAAKVQIPPNVYGHEDWDQRTDSTAYTVGQFVSFPGEDAAYFECTTAGVSAATAPAPNTAAGAATVDGAATWTARVLPDAAKGRARIAPYGEVKDMPLLLIDEATHTYQYADPSLGAVQSLDAVYVNGLAISSGYTHNAAGNFIRFAANPQGTVTADLKGLKPGGTYCNLPGDIWAQWLQTLCDVDEADIGADALAEYNGDVPFKVGLVLDRQSAMKDWARRLFAELLTAWGATRDGEFYLFRIKRPSGASEIDITDDDIPEDDEAFWVGDAETDDGVIYRKSIGYDRCHSTTTRPDDTVSESRRLRLGEKYRYAHYEDATIQAKYPSAAAVTGDSCLVEESAALAVGQWHVELLGARLRMAKVQAQLGPVGLRLGKVAKIIHHRHGFNAGVDVRVLGVRERPGDGINVTVEGIY